MKKKSANIILLLIVCTLSFATAANNKKKKSVSIQELKMQEIFDSFSYPVWVKSGMMANVLSEGQGQLTDLKVEIGDHVKKRPTVSQY